MAKRQSIVVPDEKPFFCGSELIYRDDDMGPIAHVAVGFEGVPWKSPGAFLYLKARLRTALRAAFDSCLKKENGD